MTEEQKNKLKNYLSQLPISQEEKRYIYMFYQKEEYITRINDVLINLTNVNHIDIGFGNLNSKTMFLIKNASLYKEIKPFLSKTFERFGIDMYSTYISFIDKSGKCSEYDITNTAYEIYAIRPELVYVIDTNEEMLGVIKNECFKCNASYEPRMIFISFDNVIACLNEDESISNMAKQILWPSIRNIINYKNKEFNKKEE